MEQNSIEDSLNESSKELSERAAKQLNDLINEPANPTPEFRALMTEQRVQKGMLDRLNDMSFARGSLPEVQPVKNPLPWVAKWLDE